MAKRRKFTAEEKLKIVLEGMRDGVAVADVCRRHDIYSNQYYSWKKKALRGAKDGLKAKKKGKSRKAKKKEEELENLRKIVADLKVKNELLQKKTFRSFRRFKG